MSDTMACPECGRLMNSDRNPADAPECYDPGGDECELFTTQRTLAALESSARECALALASKTEEAERLAGELARFSNAYRAENFARLTEERDRLREALRNLLPVAESHPDIGPAMRLAIAAARALSSPESAPAPGGVSSAPCRCTGLGTNPSHKPPCAPASDADEPLDGWPCVECGRAGEACVCGPCGVLGCRNDGPCPVHDTDAHARDLRRLDERDRVVGAPRAPAPESTPCFCSRSRFNPALAHHAADHCGALAYVSGDRTMPACSVCWTPVSPCAPAPESAETANSSSKEG